MTVQPATRFQGVIPSLDPGKIRGLQRVATPDGFFTMLALDHLLAFKDLLAEDRATVTYRQAVDAKLELVRAIAPVASAFLLEAQYSLAQVVAARALPANSPGRAARGSSATPRPGTSPAPSPTPSNGRRPTAAAG